MDRKIGGVVGFFLLSALSPLALASPASPLLDDLQSLKRLREAVKAVEGEPAIRGLLKSGEHQLAVTRRAKGAGIETTQFAAYFRGIEVIGSSAFHHRGPLSTTVRDLIARFDVETRPTLSDADALAVARAWRAGLEPASPPSLRILPGEDDAAQARLVYWIRLESSALEPGADLLIDAHSGERVAEIPHAQELAQIHVYESTAGCQDVEPATGAPTRLRPSQCRQTVVNGRALPEADASSRRAAFNSRTTLEYFLSRHGRNSFDARGGAVTSLVHVGLRFDNAFWNSQLKLMAYGDGNGVTTGDFTSALDVAAHELTHGIVSETAKLLYFGQSGALNEAYADFFGKMVAQDGNWGIGRALHLGPDRARGFRDLAEPGSVLASYRDESGVRQRRPFPAHMADRLVAAGPCDRRINDNCWVHVNATIPGHASYLVHQAIGRERAERLYYTVLTQYLNERANFRVAATATLQACGQLYDDAICRQVAEAFAAVGL